MGDYRKEGETKNMIRMNLNLDEWTNFHLKELARTKKTTMAEIVRGAIKSYVLQNRRKIDLTKLAKITK